MTLAAPARPALVLVLSGRRTAEHLKAAGFRVGLVSASLPWDLALLADVPIEANLDDWPDLVERIERIHRTNPVTAVVTQLERLLPLAGRLRERLGLQGGITERAALDCMDKAATIRLLREAGVPVASSAVVGSTDEARSAFADLGGTPVIVKPRDGSSAAGLAYCDSADATADAVAAILAEGRDSALVEQFLDGAELAVFAYRSRGRTGVISCLRPQIGPAPKFVKLGADHPVDLDPATLEEVGVLTDRALAAVGVDDWVATVQMMLTAEGLYLMEINPRVPGGQTVELIAQTTGYEPTLAAAEAAVGAIPQAGTPNAPYGWYRCLTFPTAGRLHYRPGAEDDVPGLETAIPPLVDIDVAPGEMVLPINHPRGGVFGRIVLCGDSPQQLERDYARLTEALALRLEPLPEAEEEALWRPQSRCC